MRLAEQRDVVELLDAVLMPNWLLSTMQSIRLFPGETRQPWHADDTFYPVPRPHAPLAVSVIWALEDFNAENGATELVAGSHRWAEEHPDDHPRTVVQAIMPAGSALVFDGALWHRGGENRVGGHAPLHQPAVLPAAVAQAAGVAAPHRATRARPQLHRPRPIDARLQHPSTLRRAGRRQATPLRLVDPDYPRSQDRSRAGSPTTASSSARSLCGLPNAVTPLRPVRDDE